MKVRVDFVTNSSTTSFVIITTGDFKKGDLFELMGVSEQSPLLPLFDALYYSLQKSMYPAEEYFSRYYGDTTGDWLELLRSKFAEEVVERIVGAQQAGCEVFMGMLCSDENLIESFFCVESFEVENDKVYFNALECAW